MSTVVLVYQDEEHGLYPLVVLGEDVCVSNYPLVGPRGNELGIHKIFPQISA